MICCISDPDLEDLDQNVSRYNPASLELLVQTTRFSRRELQLIYRAFKQECPTGIVSSEKFRELYCQFFPLGGTDGRTNGLVLRQKFQQF